MIDSHAHLDYDVFDEDREAMISRALESGITHILNICLGPEADKMERAMAMSELHPGFYSAVGVHPHDADKMTDECLTRLRTYTERDKVIAIGEIGLDYYYDHSDREAQKRVFADLLDLAIDTNLPVSIHTRNAHEDTFKLLKEKQVFERVGGIIHCFTGKPAEAEEFVSIGAHISFSGIVTFKKAVEVAEAVKRVPMERILIETDAPFLTPEPYRGKRNEPAFVQYVAARIASIKGISTDEVATTALKNFKKLFKLT